MHTIKQIHSCHIFQLFIHACWALCYICKYGSMHWISKTVLFVTVTYVYHLVLTLTGDKSSTWLSAFLCPSLPHLSRWLQRSTLSASALISSSSPTELFLHPPPQQPTPRPLSSIAIHNLRNLNYQHSLFDHHLLPFLLILTLSLSNLIKILSPSSLPL